MNTNILRLIAITLPMMLLIACGGGGGGGTATAPTTPPTNMPGTDDPNTPPTVTNPLAGLAEFESSTGHSSIQAVSEIVTAPNADLLTSHVAEMGTLSDEVKDATTCIKGTNTCSVPRLPNDDVASAGLRFQNKPSPTDISLIPNTEAYFFDDYASMVTPDSIDNAVTLARGHLKGIRVIDGSSAGVLRVEGHPIEVQTFAGWLDGSVFATTQILSGASVSGEDRFVSYTVGVPSGSNPSATGLETSATWEGSAVASIKENRTFILGDAEITVNFTDTNVDLTFGNWRNLDNEELPMPPITYGDLDLTSGSFTSSKSTEQVQGRFYGTDHAEVGGFFNTMDVTGAFGGTRQ